MTAIPTDRHSLEWTPYDNSDDILFDSGGLPFVLKKMSNFSNNVLANVSRSTPGQLGETLIGLSSKSRSLQVTIAVAAEEQDREDYWEQRRRLIAALATPLNRPGELPKLGLLKFHRPGQPTLLLDAVPLDSPKEGARPDPTQVEMDILFLCPEPYWRPDADTVSLLVAEATEFPLEFPMEWLSLNVQVEVDNEGQVDVPMEAYIYGACVNPSLTLVETGETIRFDYTLTDNDYIYINTGFGVKQVTLHHLDDPDFSLNMLPFIDLSVSTFWYLRRGANTVLFEADTNTSGSASVTWSPRYAGV